MCGFPVPFINIRVHTIFSYQHLEMPSCLVLCNDFFLSFFLSFFPSFSGIYPPQSRTYKLRDLQPKCPWFRYLKRSNIHWTRTLDRYTRAGLRECVVNIMSGPPPETTQDRTKRTHIHKHAQFQDTNENF